MQLKENNSEIIKSEIFEEVYQQVLKGEIKDLKLIDLVFKYFYKNSQLFELYYQLLKEEPVINYHQKKNCYSCGSKGHIKINCELQGLAEEEIEWIFSKPLNKQEVVIEEGFDFTREVLFEDIPDEVPYDEDPYED